MTIEPDAGPEALKAAIEEVAAAKADELPGDYFSVTQGVPDSPVAEVFTLIADDPGVPVIESNFEVCAAIEQQQPNIESTPTMGPLPS